MLITLRNELNCFLSSTRLSLVSSCSQPLYLRNLLRKSKGQRQKQDKECIYVVPQIMSVLYDYLVKSMTILYQFVLKYQYKVVNIWKIAIKHKIAIYLY